jgi:tetratricopeptide (TPR) repeat protein
MAMFYFSALLSYHRWTTTAAAKWYAASFGLLGLAALSKESALWFPFALLVWEWAQRTPWRRVVARQWPFWVFAAALAIGVLFHSGYSHLLDQSLHQRPLLDGVLTQLLGTSHLLGKLVWPMALNIDPDLPIVHQVGLVLPQVVGLVLALTLAWRARTTRPWLSLGLAWALAHLLLFNALLPRADVANERQLYWGDWALFFAFAAAVEEFWPRRWRSLLALLATGLVVVTVARNAVYKSEIALWRDTVSRSPGKARAYNNLGYAFDLAGRRNEALQAYQRALEIDPDYVKARNNLDRNASGASAAP